MTRRLALVASATLAVLLLSTPANAADACWQRLLRDWSADASVDGRYPVACYRDAIANLPVDLQTYSSAPTDIDAALQARILETPPAPPRAASPAAGTEGSSWTTGGVALPLLAVSAGVVLLVGLLAALGLLVRRRGRLQHALDTRPRP